MKIIGCENNPDKVSYGYLKKGDMFAYMKKQELEFHYYIKTNNIVPSLSEKYWAIDLMTGEGVVFDDDMEVFPFEMEATIKRRFGNCINDNCTHFHFRMIDGEPCKSCSRNYSDKYEKKREVNEE